MADYRCEMLFISFEQTHFAERTMRAGWVGEQCGAGWVGW